MCIYFVSGGLVGSLCMEQIFFWITDEISYKKWLSVMEYSYSNTLVIESTTQTSSTLERNPSTSTGRIRTRISF